MSYSHPQFSHLMVYTDAPRAGAFYQVKKGDTLSSLGKKAYGSSAGWRTINLSKYNSTFKRIADSRYCSSAKVAYPKGYIALCKPYPLIWIPTANKSEPQEKQIPKSVVDVTPADPTPTTPTVPTDDGIKPTPEVPRRRSSGMASAFAVALVGIIGIAFAIKAGTE